MPIRRIIAETPSRMYSSGLLDAVMPPPMFGKLPIEGLLLSLALPVVVCAELLLPETAADIDALTPVWEKTLSTPDMTQIVVAIPADMAGKSGYVAFRHYDCTDMFEINLDDVAVTVGEPSAAPIFSAPSVHSTALSPLARRK